MEFMLFEKRRWKGVGGLYNMINDAGVVLHAKLETFVY